MVLSRVEHLEDLAWECRLLAKTFHEEFARRGLILIAERFERLARVAQDQDKEDAARSPPLI